MRVKGSFSFSWLSSLALYGGMLCALCAPLLLYNSYGWVHVIFLYKWMGAFLPVAYLTGLAGLLLFFRKRGGRLDAFGLFWLGLLLLLPLQLFYPELPNPAEWWRNWLFFGALGGAYVVFSTFFPSIRLALALRLLLFAGGLSTCIGFIQQARIYLPFVFPCPLADRFLANTGMDSILGTVLGLASFSGVWLLLSFRRAVKSGALGAFRNVKRDVLLCAYDVFFLALNLVGLWKTGARSPLLAFFCALGVLGVMPFFEGGPEKKVSSGRTSLRKKIFFLIVLGIALFGLFPRVLPVQRRDLAADLSLQAFTPAREGRIAIWAHSLEMIRQYPLLGVGLGNYKWKYLDVLPAFHEHWNMGMRYTSWAHNEYLQWVAETGIAGGLLLLGLFVWWGNRVRKRFRRGLLPWSFFWGVGACVLLGMDALFSRPFHHPESAVWLPFALAMVNREVFEDWHVSEKLRRAAGAAIALLAVFGLFVFVQSLPTERRFGWISTPHAFVLHRGQEEYPLPWAPLLLQDMAREVRWKHSIMQARIYDRKVFYQNAAKHLSDDYRMRPRLEILPELLEVHEKLGDPEQFDALLRMISEKELRLHNIPFPKDPAKKAPEVSGAGE